MFLAKYSFILPFLHLLPGVSFKMTHHLDVILCSLAIFYIVVAVLLSLSVNRNPVAWWRRLLQHLSKHQRHSLCYFFNVVAALPSASLEKRQGTLMILPDLDFFGGEEASAASSCCSVSFRFLFSFLPVRHKLVKILDKRVLLKIVKYRVLWMWLKYGVRSCLHQFHKQSRSFISRTKTLPNICLNKRKSTHTIPFQLNTLTFSAINNQLLKTQEPEIEDGSFLKQNPF